MGKIRFRKTFNLGNGLTHRHDQCPHPLPRVVRPAVRGGRTTRLLPLAALLLSSALALPGTLPSAAKLRAQASSTSPVVASLPTGAKLEVKRCTATWCNVTAAGKTGWLPRGSVKVNYAACKTLATVGLTNIRKDEPSYTSGLDRDGDGVGCDKTG